ncbi:HD domain-containing protein [Limisalsivibrio acetivorans]|uniref:Ppx/GppA phosphatase family protein n=1 Tax=Limisalsivibrio acetivorans TaxID=1304888 RepID=UPI0003B6B0D4|nr:HD domain-containing protein [Limisalsivibrio acetivorans]
MKNGLFASINIGASAFRMIICEYRDGEERVLETLVKPLGLGKDTFTKGYITLDNVYKATRIMQNFRNKLDEFGIKKNYKCVCTSGVREARNRYFLIDHIFQKTGIKLDVVDPSEEVYVKYIGVKNDIPDFDKYERKGVIFANISSGNVSLNIIKDGVSIFSGTLPYGSLRLREIFKHIPIHSRHKAYRQYVKTMFTTISSSLGGDMSIKYIVCSGSSVNTLLSIFKPEDNFFMRKQLEELYEQVKDKPSQENMMDLGIRMNEAKVLVPMLEMYLRLLSYVKSDRLRFSRLTFPHIMTRYYSKSVNDTGFNTRLRKTLYFMGERFNFDKLHAKTVAGFATKLFDSLSELHNMGNKERILLEAGAILHDIGYFIDAKMHHEHSYYIANALDMPGFSKDQVTIVAFLVLMHRNEPEQSLGKRFSYLDIDTQLIIRKLESMLRIADALDTSHMQLIIDFDVQVANNRILISARTKKVPYLEKITFEQKKELFIETFGIPIELETRILYE